MAGMLDGTFPRAWFPESLIKQSDGMIRIRETLENYENKSVSTSKEKIYAFRSAWLKTITCQSLIIHLNGLRLPIFTFTVEHILYVYSNIKYIFKKSKY